MRYIVALSCAILLSVFLIGSSLVLLSFVDKLSPYLGLINTQLTDAEKVLFDACIFFAYYGYMLIVPIFVGAILAAERYGRSSREQVFLPDPLID